MAVDEHARHRLQERLDEVLGADAAVTLMSHLPPTGWVDVVTRDYLDARFLAIEERFLRVDERFLRLEQRIDASKHEILAAVRGEIHTSVAAQTRAIIFAMITAVASICALSLTLAMVS